MRQGAGGIVGNGMGSVNSGVSSISWLQGVSRWGQLGGRRVHGLQLGVVGGMISNGACGAAAGTVSGEGAAEGINGSGAGGSSWGHSLLWGTWGHCRHLVLTSISANNVMRWRRGVISCQPRSFTVQIWDTALSFEVRDMPRSWGIWV